MEHNNCVRVAINNIHQFQNIDRQKKVLEALRTVFCATFLKDQNNRFDNCTAVLYLLWRNIFLFQFFLSCFFFSCFFLFDFFSFLFFLFLFKPHGEVFLSAPISYMYVQVDTVTLPVLRVFHCEICRIRTRDH